MSMLDKNGLTEAEFLAAYDPTKWERPSVTVDIFCYCKQTSSILLIKRGGHPFIGRWALPGGFLEPDETAEAGAARELFEETGVHADSLFQLRTYSEPKRDPRTRIVTVAFVAIFDRQPKAVASDDAAYAEWVSIKDLKKSGSQYTFTLSGKEEIRITLDVITKNQFETKSVAKAEPMLACDHQEIISAAVLRLIDRQVISL